MKCNNAYFEKILKWVKLNRDLSYGADIKYNLIKDPTDKYDLICEIPEVARNDFYYRLTVKDYSDMRIGLSLDSYHYDQNTKESKTISNINFYSFDFYEINLNRLKYVVSDIRKILSKTTDCIEFPYVDDVPEPWDVYVKELTNKYNTRIEYIKGDVVDFFRDNSWKSFKDKDSISIFDHTKEIVVIEKTIYSKNKRGWKLFLSKDLNRKNYDLSMVKLSGDIKKIIEHACSFIILYFTIYGGERL